MSTVTFAGVSKRYDSLVAVNEASFEIGEGSWWVITGPNGSGKSTLLQLATGLQDPSSGEVRIDKASAGSTDARREISYLGDSPAFFSDLSVREHAEYVAGLFRDEAVLSRAVEVLERFDLMKRYGDRPETFSRGMKQKAALALVLARPASVLLLDEPTRGLDEAGASGLVELLSERNDGGSTVVTITHEPDRFARQNQAGVQMFDGFARVL